MERYKKPVTKKKKKRVPKPTQSQSQKQVVNIKIGDTKRKSKRKSKPKVFQQVQPAFARQVFQVVSSNDPRPDLAPLNPTVANKLNNDNLMEVRRKQQELVNSSVKIRGLETELDRLRGIIDEDDKDLEVDEAAVNYFRNELVQMKQNIYEGNDFRSPLVPQPTEEPYYNEQEFLQTLQDEEMMKPEPVRIEPMKKMGQVLRERAQLMGRGINKEEASELQMRNI